MAFSSVWVSIGVSDIFRRSGFATVRVYNSQSFIRSGFHKDKGKGKGKKRRLLNVINKEQ